MQDSSGQEVVELDGAIVTTNQLDDYVYRGNHPLVKHMTLYVYSMWVYRAERIEMNETSPWGQIDFHPAYKLAQGFVQRIAGTERVPKIDGYTMPPPRAESHGAVQDRELNAMFKSVLHRPIEPSDAVRSDSSVHDPLEPYAKLHEQPLVEDPHHPWTPTTAFTAAWHSHLSKMHFLARSAQRKYLARRELPTLWETQEATDVLCHIAELRPEAL